MPRCRLLLCIVFILAGLAPPGRAAEAPLRVGVFRVDVTPALGSPVAYAPARKIDDPLSARGIVLLGAGPPIVLCAVDAIGIGNESHAQWRASLAQAVDTTADRVAVHVLHQHDAPRHDVTIEAILDRHGLGGTRFDLAYERDALRKIGQAARAAVKSAQPCTHLEVGKAKVDRVASNRRILGPDNKVKLVRFSASKIPAAIAAPEGVIDPYVQLVSFWNRAQPCAVLTYYACHPQSYYGKGDVTAEFIGLGRALREKALNDLPHIHFNGAGGNVAAGKYNDGSPALRPLLAERVAAGMKAAWDARRPLALQAEDVAWRTRRVVLPVAPHLVRDTIAAMLADPKAGRTARFDAASQLAFLDRARQGGYPVELSRLKLGSVYLLHMPGELFVEYQLAAQALRPKDTVCMAAYGDYSPFYIGTEIAYAQGGYEVQPNSTHVAPTVEPVLMEAIRALLE